MIGFGWVTEWLIVHAWKACVPKGTGGSNPPPSAPASLSQAWMDRLSTFASSMRRQSGAPVLPLPAPVRVRRPDGEFDEFRNEPIRDVLAGRLNANESYRREFRAAFPELGPNHRITF